MNTFNKEFWNDRYATQQTGWDIGAVSSPLKDYIDQIENKNINILVPGAGNGHEVIYLLQRGFSNVTVVDIAPLAIASLKNKVGEDSRIQIFCENFFDHHGLYNLILEQTFFCALDPTLRLDYSRHCHELLLPKGKLVGVWFGKEFGKDHPPFGGNKELYIPIFDPNFDIDIMEDCYNSIPPRAGSELFIKMTKRHK